MAEKFSLDLDSDPKVITGTRIFDAPRALVFAAWTEPRHLAQWFGPNGFSLTTHDFDFRPGGTWRFVMHGPDGRDYPNCVIFDEIVPPERIAYHHRSDEIGVELLCFKTVVAFEDLGAKTRLVMQGVFPSAEARERVVHEYGKGQTETLARLADYVEEMAKAKTEATDNDFVISRTFAAPRDLVWKAWTEPERLAAWWGPRGCTIQVKQLDLRAGGHFHYAMVFSEGNQMWGRFVFREIVPPERLVFINSFSDPEGGITRAPFPQLRDTWPLEVLTSLTFTDEGDKTGMTLRAHPINATDAERAAFAGMLASMQMGYGASFDALDKLLGAMTAANG